MRGISCDRAVGLGPNKILSVPDAVGQAIDRYMAEKEGIQEALPLTVPAPASSVAATGVATATMATHTHRGASASSFDISTCPECNAGHMVFEEGCRTCHICGYSECG